MSHRFFQAHPAEALAIALFAAAGGLTLVAEAALAQPKPPPAPARAPAADPRFAAAETAFSALPETERKAIQSDLIWAAGFTASASGGFGPLTFRAINAFKTKLKGTADGLLNPAERKALGDSARLLREAAGFQIVADTKTGARIGIPKAVLPKSSATPSGGGRWQSADEKVTLDTRTGGPNDNLPELFEKATATTVPGRKITYKLLKPEFYVVSGETPTGKFYTRMEAGVSGLRGFSIGYDKALSAQIDPLVIAIASSFEPFPGAKPPPSVQVPSTQGGTPAVPVSVTPKKLEGRHGTALALAPGLALTAISAIAECRTITVAGKPARLRSKDEASGLALLEATGLAAAAMPPLREGVGTADEDLVALSFGDTGSGAHALVASPARLNAGHLRAPLQPGGAGSPVFDHRGNLVGVVTANPSEKFAVAGVVPARAYKLALKPDLDRALASAGQVAKGASADKDLSTGALVERLGKSVAAVACPP